MSQPLLSTDIPPFAEILEIKKRIDKLEVVLSDVDVVKLKLITEFAEAIGLWRCSQCKLNINNICNGWRLSQEFVNKIIAVAGSDAVIQQDNIYRLNLLKLPFIGVLCPIYVAKT